MNTPLSVLLDANPLTHTLSGVGKVTLSHLEALSVDERINAQSWALTMKPLVVPSPVANQEIPLHHRASSWLLPWFDKTPSILHGTNAIFPRWMVGLNPQIKVLTIHDVTLLHPEFRHIREKSVLRYHVKRSIDSAHYFFCVSETTRQDLIAIKPDAETRSFVVHPDLPNQFYQWLEKDKSSLVAPVKPYVLFIGNLNERKNPLALIRGFKKAFNGTSAPFRLILAGQPGNQWANIRREADGKDIELMGYVSDEKVWELLRGALALAMPSRYEGFGLQVKEAEWLGVPVLLSDIPVFRELFSKSTSFWAESEESWADIFSMLQKGSIPLQKPEKPTGRPMASRYGDVYLKIC